MIKGLVSCIVPTYKRSDSLIRAIESILEQTYEKIEVIVVDDNNPNDKYSSIVQEQLKLIEDSRLRYIQQEKHINGAVARNIGIRESKGEYIAFLDDDDEWLPNKLESQIQMLDENPEFSAVSCLYTYYYDNKPIRKCQPYNSNNLHRKVLDRSVSICTPTVVFRKVALDKSGYFDESLTRHQDLQLFLDYLVDNKMIVLPEYHVLIHTEIGGNRPTVENIEQIKSHFFKKMDHHFKRYNIKEQKSIYAAHYFEIILIALREKKIKPILKYLFKIGWNLDAYNSLFQRYKGRKKYSV